MSCLEDAPDDGRVACRPRALLSTVPARAQHLPNSPNYACNNLQLNYNRHLYEFFVQKNILKDLIVLNIVIWY